MTLYQRQILLAQFCELQPLIKQLIEQEGASVEAAQKYSAMADLYGSDPNGNLFASVSWEKAAAYALEQYGAIKQFCYDKFVASYFIPTSKKVKDWCGIPGWSTVHGGLFPLLTPDPLKSECLDVLDRPLGQWPPLGKGERCKVRAGAYHKFAETEKTKAWWKTHQIAPQGPDHSTTTTMLGFPPPSPWQAK